MKKHLITTCLLCLCILLHQPVTAQWSQLGAANPLNANGLIYSVTADANGNVYAGGEFMNSTLKRYVAKWNKQTNAWSELGGNNSLSANRYVRSIIVDDTNNIYAAGEFSNGGLNYLVGSRYVAKWRSATNTWSELGGVNGLGANDIIFTLAKDTAGNIFAAGDFTNAAGKRYVAKWDKTTNTWSELGGINSLKANGTIRALATDSSGNVYAGGSFADASGIVYVAKWSKATNTWSALGVLSTEAFGGIVSIAIDKGSNIYTTGYFMNSLNKTYVARCNKGSDTWFELGGLGTVDAFSSFTTMTCDKDGNVYATGGWNSSQRYWVAKWTAANNTWSELGGTNSFIGTNWAAFTIATDNEGNVFTAGGFGIPNEYVAKYPVSTALPVKLTGITANRTITGDIAIQWQTVQEINTASFVVERSSNGSIFTTLGNVEAKGSGANTYTFTDTKPLDGTAYYRLKIKDKDVSSTYSNIVTVKSRPAGALSIYPNPSSTIITIAHGKMKANATIAILQSNGQQVKSQRVVPGAVQTVIDVSSLPAGEYMVTVSDGVEQMNALFTR